MQDWLPVGMGEQTVKAALWTFGALLLLAIVLVVMRMLRGGKVPFAGHGRDRRPRLALGESIEIDNQRRLVLVRRDDVEHLILTGGPSDVVVEQGIRLSPVPAPARREHSEPAIERHVPRPAAVAPEPVRHAEERRPVTAARPEPVLDAPPMPSPEPVVADTSQPAPIREERRPLPQPPSPGPAVNPVHAAARLPGEPAPAASMPQSPPAPAARGPEEDDVVEFPQAEVARLRRQAEGRRDSSLEDEMSRLLEDISDEKR